MQKIDYMKIRGGLNFSLSREYCFRHLSQDLILFGVAGYLVWIDTFASYLAASVMIACVCFRAFSAMHEAVHNLLHPDRLFNDGFGLWWGTLCFLPYLQWKRGHLQHHYWAGNIEKDPVMKLPLYIKNGGKLGFMVEIAWKIWFPILAIMQQCVFWLNCVLLLRKARPSVLEFFSVVLPPVVWSGVALLLGPKIFLGVILPAILLYLVLVEVVNFPHHLELPQYDGDVKLSVLDQHLISRSCTYFGWMERIVLLNFNYHVEHHLFPTLPFGELKKAHELVKATIGPGYNEELGFTWIWRSRKKQLAQVLHEPARIQTERKVS